uniref:Mitogen-activated protein kinase kinase kinase 7 n=2 Tax=Lygus hesperus TaxID=30085 RepID=A0A146KQ11_LYGHE
MAGISRSLSNLESVELGQIDFQEVLGKGSFGVVRRAVWKNQVVAVKISETETEKQSLNVELHTLARVNHDNIIKLISAYTKQPFIIIMEFAENGSLYEFLHPTRQPSYKYTAGHAVSWALQCAQGVAYLHSRKPPIIHRDLKPPNLLLVQDRRKLKICDFGTARDMIHSMTNNKGTAAWMAPEVFEGKNYTEKCDVYSWGIILWEVLSRKKPFVGRQYTMIGLQWAVHKGERPDRLVGCPAPLENLYMRCWDKELSVRPSMEEIVSIMSRLLLFFNDYDTPIVDETEDSSILEDEGEDYDESLYSFGDAYMYSPRDSRNGPHLPANPNLPELSLEIDTDSNGQTVVPPDQDDDQSMYDAPNIAIALPKRTPEGARYNEGLEGIYHAMLDPQLQPVTPDPHSAESMQIFEDHKKLVKEYFEVQEEMVLLTKDMERLNEELSRSTDADEQHIKALESEKEELIQLKKSFENQLAQAREQGSVEDGEWVVCTQSHLST